MTLPLPAPVVLTISVTIFLLSVCELGLIEGLTWKIASLLAHGRPQQTPAAARHALGWSLLFSAVAAVAMAALAEPIAHLVGAPEIAGYIAWSSLWLVPLGVVRVVTGVFQGYQEMRYSFVASLLREPIKVAAVALFAVGGLTVFQAVLGWVASSWIILAAACVLLWIFFRRKGFRLGQRVEWEGPGILSYSVAMYLPYLSIALLPVVMKLIVGRFSPTGGVGRFDISLSLATMTMIVFVPISGSLLPAISAAWHRGDPLNVLASTSTRVVGLVALGSLVLFYLAGDVLLGTIYGTEYRAAEPILWTAAVAIYFDAFKASVNSLLKGCGQAWMSTAIEVVKMVVAIALGIVLAIHHGAVGAMTGFAAGCFVAALLQVFSAWRRLGLNCWSPFLTLTAYAALAVTGFILGCQWLTLAVLVLLMAWRPPISREEISIIAALIRRPRNV